MDGSLHEHQKLPSTRELSSNLNVSRTIVIDAYEQLLAEGYTYSLGGSGTYVNKGIRFNKPIIAMKEIKEDNDFLYPEYSKNFGFRTGVPDLDKVPIMIWGKLYKNVLCSINKQQLDYHNPMGDFELRKELTKYLRRIRGVETNPNQILITNGAAQGFSLLKSFLNHNDFILIENPISQGIIKTLKENNICYKPINVDEMGIITKNLPINPPKLILTTPSHQFPTGIVMTIKRRIELIKYAEKHNSYIVEDDYDSEYRYEGEPIQALQSLNPNRVIYIGSFSKTFCPAIRLGYMILPEILVETVKRAKYGSDLHSPLFEQITMANFIKFGYFEKHIRKMKKIYHKRRDYLIEELKRSFGDKVKITGANAGLHLIATFHSISFNDSFVEDLKNNHIYAHPLIEYDIFKEESKTNNSSTNKHSLVLGFGNMENTDISKGIDIIYHTLHKNSNE
jgi:GntR family transcriptional regulator/MocR family aminotransferase